MAEVTFSFEDLRVYKTVRELVKNIYLLQNKFPKEERYALGDQVRRAATSITANIAEGSGRQSVKEKIHFIEIAFGSMTEVFCEPTPSRVQCHTCMSTAEVRRRKTIANYKQHVTLNISQDRSLMNYVHNLQM